MLLEWINNNLTVSQKREVKEKALEKLKFLGMSSEVLYKDYSGRYSQIPDWRKQIWVDIIKEFKEVKKEDIW